MQFCSVGWDGKLMVWELPEVEDALKKKRKTLGGVVAQEIVRFPDSKLQFVYSD
jgi:hypothetical protein